MHRFLKTVALALIGSAVAWSAIAAETIKVPMLSYRVGPFAATGIPLMDGHRDYFELLNARDGGINGVKVEYVECETSYNTERGVECYEKTKNGAVVTQPWSTGITLQVIPKTNVDKIPVFSSAYGLSAGAVGTVFPWVFNPPVTYWDGASVILKHIAGGQDLSGLKGKKIALLHLDHPYGKEPIRFFEKMARTEGFEFITIPVGLKEMQNQSSQWLQIRRAKPDWVVMWGWGAMNAGAITEAVKTRFPMDRFVGIWWSGHDADLELVGDKGKGYKALSFNLPGRYPIHDDLKTHVFDTGYSYVKNVKDTESTFYTRGLVMAAMIAESIATAQKKYGNVAINAEQFRWGMEHLNITAERWAELGMKEIAPPMSLTCADHSGHHPVWVLEWDGKNFVKTADAINPDKFLVRPMLERVAADYERSNAPWPGRDGIACN